MSTTERIVVFVRNNRFVVVVRDGKPADIYVLGHSEDEPWGDAILTEAERQEIYTAALEKLYGKQR